MRTESSLRWMTLAAVTASLACGVDEFEMDGSTEDMESALSGAAHSITAVTASCHQRGNGPTNVSDGRLDTRWSCFGKGAYVTIDLGTSRSVDSAAVAWYAGNTRTNRFAISTSLDGKDFELAYAGSSSGRTTAHEQYDFAERSARYLRLTVNGNTSNDWASVTELRAISRSSAPPSSTQGTAGPLLRWRPPAGNYVDRHIGQADGGSTIQLTPGVDYNIIFDSPVKRRITFYGGRNIKIIGGEINIDSSQENTQHPRTSGHRYNPSNGLEFRGQTGVIFLEGLRIHGAYALDSIRFPSVPDATIYIQNCRLESDRIISGLTDVADGFFHTDGIQIWGGTQGLYLNRVTIINPYQGGMIGDGVLVNPWKTTVFDQVNFRAGPRVGQVTKLINFVARSALQGPMVLQGDTVYYEPGPGWSWSTAYASPGTPSGAFYSSVPVGVDSQGRAYGEPKQSNVVNGITNGAGAPGRIYKGLPPGGDYVPASRAGMNYKSPGYR